MSIAAEEVDIAGIDDIPAIQAGAICPPTAIFDAVIGKNPLAAKAAVDTFLEASPRANRRRARDEVCNKVDWQLRAMDSADASAIKVVLEETLSYWLARIARPRR